MSPRSLGSLLARASRLRPATAGRRLLRLLMSQRFALPVVLALGVSLSLLLFFSAREVDESRMRDRFERAAANRVAALRAAVEHAVEDVEALGALFDTAGEVDRAQFRTFAARLLARGQGTQALEWIPRVPDAARARFEEAASRDGYARFRFTDRKTKGVMVRAARRPEYYPVYYVEPYAGNEAALGFDLAPNATRREAMERSAASGEMTGTAPITLVQETARQAGVLLFSPIYRAPVGESAASRRDRLAGFVLGVYRIGQLAEGAIGRLAPDGVDVYLLDDMAQPGETLLHFHSSRLRGAAASPAADGLLPRGLHHTAVLRVADRTWRVVCAPAPELLATGRTWYPWALLAANLLVTGLLAGYLLLVLRRAARVRAHAAELLRAKEQLLQSQKMEAIGQLASGVAHDFNNLLAVIRSSAQFLRDDLPAGDPRRADVEEIWQAGERAVQLTRQLLAFGRKSPANPVLVDVSAAVRAVEKLLRRMVGEDVALSTSLEERPWRTRVDPGHLDQVLMNLVVNARDAMPDGGDLRVETRNIACEQPPRGCEGLLPGRYVVLSVADTGSGIPGDLLHKIFEPFFTTKEPGKGTGLGLATVYGIVEQAKGKIAVSSQVGRGTTFTAYLPACDAAALATSEPAAAPAWTKRERVRARTVLLVEDDEPVRRVTRRMLERRGFEVKEAPDAVEAVRQLSGRESPVDLVLSDVVMPEVKGTDLAIVIRELRPDVPVVLMSGYADRQQVSEARILRKPFTEDALLAHIEEALGIPGAAAASGGAPSSRELRS